jgi:hypothetical protein
MKVPPSVSRRARRLALLGLCSAALLGCAENWTQTKITNANASAGTSTKVRTSTPPHGDDVLLTEGDITDRKYTVLGDLAVTVNKLTVFNADPTREQVDAKLKAEASKLGADAVILVRYGAVGISAVSWGSLDGKGRAIKFER